MRPVLFGVLLGAALFFAPFLFFILFLFFIFRGRRRFYYRSEIISIDGRYERSNAPQRHIPIH